MSRDASSSRKPQVGRSPLILSLALALVLALTALVAEMNPVPESDSDPLHRDDELAAGDVARNARAAQDLYLRAIRSRDRGDIHVAKSLLKRALEAHPDDVDAMQALGEIYYAETNYDHARTFFERCLQARPERMESYANLAIVHLCQSNFDAAGEVVEAGLEASPQDQHGPLYLILACARDGQGRHDDELHYLQLAQSTLGADFEKMTQSRWVQPLHHSTEFQDIVMRSESEAAIH